MSNYIKLLFCAVVSVALFYGCDNDDNNINPGRTPKFSEKSYISVYIKAKQLRYFYMSALTTVYRPIHIYDFLFLVNGIMMKRQKRWQESLVTRPIIVYRDFIFWILLSATQ